MKYKSDIESNYFQKLQEAIFGILNNSHSIAQENFLLHSAHAIAVNLLRIKFSKNPTVKNYLGLNEHDLGYDCIAELFERDPQGNIIHLKTYFSNFDTQQLTEKEFLLHFRRLVSSAVNQNLMHVYRDFDPSLGKIIRNIKLSIAAHKAFEETERFDELCIVPIYTETQEELPSLTQDELLDMLSPHVTGNEFVPELLSILSRILREQIAHCRIIPLITAALTFRTLLSTKQLSENETGIMNSEFETTEIITKNVERIQTSILSHNHHAGTNVKTIEMYFNAIQNILLTKINATETPAETLFAGLKLFIEELDERQYKQCHRTKLEYYYKLCREAIASDLLERKIKT